MKRERRRAEHILSLVASYYEVHPDVLRGRSRKRLISDPRMVGMYLCVRYTDLPLYEIGMCFGGRDHSTVIHARDAVEDRREFEGRLQDDLEALETELERGGLRPVQRTSPYTNLLRWMENKAA